MVISDKISRKAVISAAKKCMFGDGDYVGWCIKCGKKHSQIEPDAHEYTCKSCGAKAVYGAEELVMMGI
jgi:DNA-directed RNA polymerase subunit RPC12/RpoP